MFGIKCGLKALTFAFCAVPAAHGAEADLTWISQSPPAEGYSIHLTEVTPAPGTPLVAGSTIEFKATATYAMTVSNKGLVVLVFQDDAGELAQLDRPQVVQEVSGPIGSVTLSDRVRIPERAKELFLFIPLVPDGLATTTGEITIRYPVDPHVASNAPVDISYHMEDANAMIAEQAPYVEQARAAYPDAKARYLAGLPPKHAFFVTFELRDRKGKAERVFVAVSEIADGVVRGRIWNDIELVEGYEFRQEISLPESEVLDWTITRPDGTEEGNFIGKFLDSKQQ